jgi:methenyltetrahydromethanopterin cyclohydrolase
MHIFAIAQFILPFCFPEVEGDPGMMGINEMGFEVFEEMLDYQDELQLEVHELDNGTVVVDAGVKAHGGLGAGVYLARLCMADLADIQAVPCDVKGILLPGVQVATDHPAVSCMASQCAMWQIKTGKYFAMGSGPARVLARKTKDLYEKIGFEEFSDVGVLVLESSKLPDASVSAQIAESCGIDPADLRLAVAPTDSVAGMVQISARVVETGLHKLFSMGFDITDRPGINSRFFQCRLDNFLLSRWIGYCESSGFTAGIHHTPLDNAINMIAVRDCLG